MIPLFAQALEASLSLPSISRWYVEATDVAEVVSARETVAKPLAYPAPNGSQPVTAEATPRGTEKGGSDDQGD